MATVDKAYNPGLTLPSASDEFKENGKQKEKVSAGSEGQGNIPVAGTPPKERASMNKLFIGDGESEGKSLSSGDSGGSGIKQRTSTSNNPKRTVPSAMTPTSRLAGQLGSISFKVGAEGKHSSLADSPTSDYASGNFSSLGSGNFPSLVESDHGYESMSSMPSLGKPEQIAAQNNPSLEKPALITGEGSMDEEDMEVDKARASIPPTDKPPSMINIQDAARVAGKVSVRTSSETSESSGLSPAPLSLLASSPALRNESPGPASVPPIAEDIEIVTEYVPSPSPSERLRQEGMSSKRSATGLLEVDLGPSTKNPRLSPEALSKFGNVGGSWQSFLKISRYTKADHWDTL